MGPQPDLVDPGPRQDDGGPARPGPFGVQLLDDPLELVELEVDQPALDVDSAERQLKSQSRDLHTGLGSRGASARSRRVYGGPWPRLRLEVLNRDGWRCQVRGERCQGVASVVDHIVPVRAWPLVGQVEFASGLPQLQHGDGVCGVCVPAAAFSGVVTGGRRFRSVSAARVTRSTRLLRAYGRVQGLPSECGPRMDGL